jgi:hypothetical protein
MDAQGMYDPNVSQIIVSNELTPYFKSGLVLAKVLQYLYSNHLIVGAAKKKGDKRVDPSTRDSTSYLCFVYGTRGSFLLCAQVCCSKCAKRFRPSHGCTIGTICKSCCRSSMEL